MIMPGYSFQLGHLYDKLLVVSRCEYFISPKMLVPDAYTNAEKE